MTTLTTSETVERELRRVFGVPATVEPLAGGLVSVAVEGWPDAITYRADRLFAVLVGFGDGHGSTEAGDAEVCATLERLGAVATLESVATELGRKMAAAYKAEFGRHPSEDGPEGVGDWDATAWAEDWSTLTNCGHQTSDDDETYAALRSAWETGFWGTDAGIANPESL